MTQNDENGVKKFLRKNPPNKKIKIISLTCTFLGLIVLFLYTYNYMINDSDALLIRMDSFICSTKQVINILINGGI